MHCSDRYGKFECKCIAYIAIFKSRCTHENVNRSAKKNI